MSDPDHLQSAEDEPETTGELPRAIRDYILYEMIGRGGFGEVYRAHHTRTWKDVVVKILNDDRHDDASARERFTREASIGSQLRHPNIVQVIEHGEADGVPYLVMPYVGPNLLTILFREPIERGRSVAMLRAIADAVHHAHRQGYLHRDIKPANIFVDTQTDIPVIGDFGLAKDIKSSLRLSGSRDVLGTQPYMPPEQADPRLGDFSAATDVYALGATLYQLLTGHTPFPRSDRPHRAIDTQIAWDRPMPPSALNPQVPSELDVVCLLCLQKSPHDRYPTAAALADDLSRFEAGKPIRGRLPGPVKRLYRRCQRQPIATAAVLASVALAAGGAIAARHYALDAHSTTQKLAGVEAKAINADAAKEAAVRRREFQEYVADMKDVPTFWRNGDIKNVELVLARHESQKPDQRGFEWYYWSGLLHGAARRMHVEFRPSSLAISDDGSVLAAAGDFRVAACDLATGTQLAIWPLDQQAQHAPPLVPDSPWQQTVAVSADGSAVASVCATVRGASRLGQLHVWDVKSGAESLKVADDPQIAGTTVRFTPDGRFVVVGGYENTWYSWDLSSHARGPSSATSGREHRTSRTPGPASLAPMNAVTDLRVTAQTITTATLRGPTWTSPWSNDGERTGFNQQLTRLGGFPLLAGPARVSVAFERGSLLLRRFDDDGPAGRARRDGRPMNQQIKGPAESTCLAIDGIKLATGDSDRIVRVREVDPSRLIAEVSSEYRGATAPIVCVALGAGRVVSADSEGGVCVWPLGERQADAVLLPPLSASTLEADAQGFASPSGRLTAQQDGSGLPLLIKSRGGDTVAQLVVGGQQATRVIYSPDERRIAVAFHAPPNPANPAAGAGSPKLVVWDLETNQQVLSTSVSTQFNTVTTSFSHDAQSLAIAEDRDGVRIVNLQDASERRLREGRPTLFAQLSDSGRYLVASGPEGSDIRERETDRSIYASDAPVRSVWFNPAETKVLLIGDHVSLVDLTTGGEVPTLLKELPVRGMSLAKDGRRLFALSGDRLRIYAVDSDDGTLLLDVACNGEAARPETIEAVLDFIVKMSPSGGVGHP